MSATVLVVVIKYARTVTKKKTYLRPKRRFWCHLGPFSSSQPTQILLVPSWPVNTYIESKYHKLVQKTRIMVPRAQTMQNASFGLVLVVAAHPNICRAVNTYIEPKKHELVQDIEKKCT
jgi:hypothetical protein